MTCVNHPDAPVAAYCRTCGKALCAQCVRSAEGTIYCEEHVPVPAGAAPPPEAPYAAPPPYTAPPPSSGLGYARASEYTAPPGYVPPVAGAQSHLGSSPGLAFILGLIPGVGAIYNGQYAKGLVHALVFGLLVSILNRHPPQGTEAIFGILLAAWFFYMAIEAYHTAKKRRTGQPVEEFSSLVEFRGSSRFPMGAIVLIGMGVLLLLDTTDIIDFDRAIRFWPVILIAAGVLKLYGRLEGGAR